MATFDDFEVARLAGALGVYDEAMALLEEQLRLRAGPEYDNRPLYAVHFRLSQSRYKLADDYNLRRKDVALNGAISAAMTKKKRPRKRAHAN